VFCNSNRRSPSQSLSPTPHGIHLNLTNRVGQNRIYAPYMTVCMVIPLLKIPDIHRIFLYMYGFSQPYLQTLHPSNSLMRPNTPPANAATHNSHKEAAPPRIRFHYPYRYSPPKSRAQTRATAPSTAPALLPASRKDNPPPPPPQARQRQHSSRTCSTISASTPSSQPSTPRSLGPPTQKYMYQRVQVRSSMLLNVCRFIGAQKYLNQHLQVHQSTIPACAG
jgi:hypothetical protein